MIDLFLLDLDDTILDFHRAEAIAVAKTMRQMEIEPTEERLALYSRINREQWQRLERGELTRAQVLLKRFELFYREIGVLRSPEETQKYYGKFLSQGHCFIDGAEEFLKRLSERGTLYILSNGNLSVQRGRLESAGIARYFKKIFLSEVVGYVKPQKEFFDACTAKIPGYSASRAIVLGDSLTSDILGGKNAGIRTCWFNPHGQPGRADIVPDAQIRRLSEFFEVLDRLNATP